MDLGAFDHFIGLYIIFFHFIMSMKGRKSHSNLLVLISNSLLKEVSEEVSVS